MKKALAANSRHTRPRAGHPRFRRATVKDVEGGTLGSSPRQASPAMTRRAQGAAAMAKRVKKRDFPVSKVRRYLEPGPVVLVSSRFRDETDIMTMGWHTVM